MNGFLLRIKQYFAVENVGTVVSLVFKKIKNNSRHGKDLIYLMLVQGTSYIFPLISLPYLSKVLGPERLGTLGFAQVITLYFILVVDYSFNQTATKYISQNSQDKNKISRYVWNVILARVLLCLMCLFLLISIIVVFTKFRTEYVIHLVSFFTVVGHVFFPVWYFQGTQQLKKVSIINFLIRLLSFIFIFILVKQKEDYFLVQVSSSIGIFVGSMIAMYMVFNQLGFIKPSLSKAWRLIRVNYIFFVTRALVSFYTYINVLLLGLFTSDVNVGYFSVVDKLIGAVKAIYSNYSQVVFPLMSVKHQGNKGEGEKFTIKAMILISLLMLFLGIIFFIFAKPIILTLFGPQYSSSIVLLRILALVPFIISVGNMLILEFAFLQKKKKIYLIITVLAGLVNIILSIILVPSIKQIGTSIAVLTSELIVMSGFVVFAIQSYKKNNLVHKKNGY